MQVDTFSKLAEFEEKTSEEDHCIQVDSQEYSKVGLPDIEARIEKTEPIGKTIDYVKLMEHYRKFEAGETFKPNYDR